MQQRPWTVPAVYASHAIPLVPSRNPDVAISILNSLEVTYTA